MSKSQQRDYRAPVVEGSEDRAPSQQDYYVLILGVMLGLGLMFLVSAYFA